MRCMWVEFLTFNILLYTKSVPNVIGDWFCTPKMFKNPIKTGFSVRNILFTICFWCLWIVNEYFLFEKQAFHGLLKVIGIQNIFQILENFFVMYKNFIFRLFIFFLTQVCRCLLNEKNTSSDHKTNSKMTILLTSGQIHYILWIWIWPITQF